MAFVEEKVDEDRNSIAVCLDAMLRKEGVMRSTSVFLEQGQSVLEILNNNLEKAQILDLTGCNMDAVLYYPNIEIPVLALLEDGNAVLIVGYNDKNVVIFEPTSGKINKKGRTYDREGCEKNGHKFITYRKNNEKNKKRKTNIDTKV